MIPKRIADNLSHPRVDLRRAEKLSRGEHYSRTSIVARFDSPTPDLVEHALRYHWAWLESMAELDEDIQCVFIDLSVAIHKLDGQEKQAVQLLVDGWASSGQYRGIADEMGIKAPEVRRVLTRAFRQVAGFLNPDYRSV